ncbi:DUF892 family protein [Desulfitobacterium sp. Sab5]|uniref:DUF892 family protein n=1 Tax=Desulfitobacterium nosdiversum TaxID=3375356 RepID=UPI003CEF4D0F
MPSILNQKERMLLQDQQHHEQLCIQKYTKYSNEAQDPQLKQLFQTHASHEQHHFDTISQILSGQVPNLNQQQGQGQQSQSSQIYNTGITQNQNTSFNQNDASLANDMLTTEKYISGTYDTTIFEIRDTNIRQVLNHIQKEEQKHGEDLYKYMQSHGMYNTPS